MSQIIQYHCLKCSFVKICEDGILPLTCPACGDGKHKSYTYDNNKWSTK